MKDYAGTALMVALTTIVGIGCYGATAHGVAQRAEIESMQRKLVADGRAIRDLQVELRTRARMPLIERWNDDVLKMSAPQAGQFMRSPVQLVSMIAPELEPGPEPGPGPEGNALPSAPQMRLAITPEAPGPGARVVQAALVDAPATEAPATLLRASYPSDER
ncbi:hypothetical protein GCM10007973_32010 [Polymorphobacter multimanifer]|uniref:Uncharacterized protein n=1 Tax=Polymorphobacter multimanifer TaxID=1070431 RepID=A0A841L5B3_9SPHN|nr:hypothetical protein [Polymorphobacter multimanifer]MBB6227610.1 hypothetical protein [Polymorphobacter multimanifer]GGI93348.1 hypothetical protein GCM10007973_32010 [Polymorphobacter multimanifer]